MGKKLSKKEQNEPVTKGFLVSNEYATRGILEEILDSKNYATKDYVADMFEIFHKRINEDFAHHTGMLIEMFQHENRLVIESLESRIKRVERFVGLSQI